MFFDWKKKQLEKVQRTRDLKDDTKFIKELDSLPKTTKDIAILQHAQKQPLFGFPRKPVQFFK